jgi:murein DD-endopeptidase MepM/ murein hydrolase activator NlpD
VKRKREKAFTVMVVPHSGKSIYSISVPVVLLKILGGLMAGIVAAVAIFSIYFSVSYREMKSNAEELAVKTRDYQELQRQLDYFVKKTQMLEERMQGLEKLDNDLRSLLKNDPALKKNLSAIVAAESVGRPILASRGSIDREQAIKNLEKLESELPEREKSLRELKEVVIQRNRRLASTPSIWPVAGSITSDFGYRRSPFGRKAEFHDGIDIAAPYGTPVRAAADGMVTFAGYRPGYGNVVTISHGYGFETSYCHNSKMLVKQGQQVKKGQIIARVGNTGRSTGPHTHYMVKVNGVLKNPADFLN